MTRKSPRTWRGLHRKDQICISHHSLVQLHNQQMLQFITKIKLAKHHTHSNHLQNLTRKPIRINPPSSGTANQPSWLAPTVTWPWCRSSRDRHRLRRRRRGRLRRSGRARAGRGKGRIEKVFGILMVGGGMKCVNMSITLKYFCI